MTSRFVAASPWPNNRWKICRGLASAGTGRPLRENERVVDRVGSEILREDKSEEELFSEFFRSEDRETRLSVLKIARDIATPDPYLYDLIAEAARDEDPEIRTMAKDIVIRTERYAGKSR